METAQQLLVVGSTVDATHSYDLLWRQSPCVGICSQPRWRRKTGHIYWSHLNQEKSHGPGGGSGKHARERWARDRPWIMDGGWRGGVMASELEAAEMEETRRRLLHAPPHGVHCMKQGQETQRTNEFEPCFPPVRSLATTAGFLRKVVRGWRGGRGKIGQAGSLLDFIGHKTRNLELLCCFLGCSVARLCSCSVLCALVLVRLASTRLIEQERVTAHHRLLNRE
ncbi:hypothetical protein J3E69DRAFT_133328 [Trichoderma sp. SZMC 28015]